MKYWTDPDGRRRPAPWQKTPADPYKSPHKLPGPQCTDPSEALDLPYTHMNRSACPVHKNNMDMMDRLPASANVSEHWKKWAMYRELFSGATADNYSEETLEQVREFYLSQMLKEVTQQNPPPDPGGIWMTTEKTPARNARLEHSMAFFSVLGVVIIVILILLSL